ncbi:MAG: PmbA/TldA family metallopeptidase, partial [Nitrosopumilaceae archaeon]
MSLCDAVLSKAKALRIDEYEAFFAERKIITVRMTDSEIAEVKQNQERSLAVRIIHQKRIGSATTSNLDKNDVVESALKSTSLVKPKNYWRTLPQIAKFSSLQNVFDQKIENISGEQAADIAYTMINAATKDKRVTAVSGSLNVVFEKIEIANSNGLNCTDK